MTQRKARPHRDLLVRLTERQAAFVERIMLATETSTDDDGIALDARNVQRRIAAAFERKP